MVMQMEGEDEILFTGAYTDFELSLRYDLSNKTSEDAAQALVDVSNKIEPYAYQFSGINTDKINSFAKVNPKGISEIILFLEKNSPKTIKDTLLQAVPKPELLSTADSYLFNRLLSNAGIKFKPVTFSKIVGKNGGTEDFIGFIGKYKEWTAIKKLGITNKVQDYEVSGILSGVNFTVVNKAFDFSSSKKPIPDLSSLKRKSYSNILFALKKLHELKLDNDPFVVCKTFETVGYKPYASPDMLTAAYPDIKPPKVKGRKPKG